MKRGLMMITAIAVTVLAVPDVPGAERQSPAEHVAALKRLEWLAGNWAGEGWIALSPGQRRSFTQTEVVQTKAFGTILTIEGHGITKAGSTNVTVLDAFTIVSFNPKENRYRWYSQSHRQGIRDRRRTEGGRQNVSVEYGSRLVRHYALHNDSERQRRVVRDWRSFTRWTAVAQIL